MAMEQRPGPAAQRVAAKVQAFAAALADDERAILATIIEQAAAHPDAIIRPADAPEVTGFDGALTFFVIGPPPPPPGGSGLAGGSGLSYTYYLKYY